MFVAGGAAGTVGELASRTAGLLKAGIDFAYEDAKFLVRERA